jgi:hypothetical protein
MSKELNDLRVLAIKNSLEAISFCANMLKEGNAGPGANYSTIGDAIQKLGEAVNVLSSYCPTDSDFDEN